MVNSGCRNCNKKLNQLRITHYALRIEFRPTGEIPNRVDFDGDNIFPAVRDEIHNLHLAGDDSRDDFSSKVFREPLENVFRRGIECADSLSVGILFRGVAAD